MPNSVLPAQAMTEFGTRSLGARGAKAHAMAAEPGIAPVRARSAQLSTPKAVVAATMGLNR